MTPPRNCQKTLVGASIARPCPFALQENRPGKCVSAVSGRATNGRPYTRNKAGTHFFDGLRSGQDRSLQAGVNGRFVGRGLDPSVPAHVAESCSCFSSVGVAASFSKYRSPLYRIFCRTFSTMVCSVRAVPVRTQSFRARVTPVYKRLR